MAILKLDDRDPSIVYSGGWRQEGSKAEFDKTTSGTAVRGATARLSFEGSSIAVYGTLGATKRGFSNPVSSYSIDGGSPAEFKPILGGNVQYGQQFFQALNLPEGQHTLTITNEVDASNSLFLDFFIIDSNPNSNPPPPPPPPPSPPSPSQPAGASSSTPSSNTASSPSQSSSISSGSSSQTSPAPVGAPVISAHAPSATDPANANSNDPSSSSSTTSSGGTSEGSPSTTGATKNSAAGAIAGGVVAAIIALALIAFALVYWRRRQRKRRFGGFRSAASYWRPMASEMTTTHVGTTVQPTVIRPTRPAFPQAASSNVAPFTQNPIYTTAAYNEEDTEANPNPARASANTFASSNMSFYVNDQPPLTSGYPSRSYLPPSQTMNHPTGEYYAQ